MNPLDFIKAKKQHVARLANQSGAAGEVRAVQEMDHWFSRPKGKQLKNLLSALAESGITIKGSSFDAIACEGIYSIDFNDIETLRHLVKRMVFIEIKTANQSRVKPGFSGFFFALTEGELLAAETLGDRHRVALYNKNTDELLMTSVSEILARSRSMNWQLSVQL